jgi:hypothetical protein
MFSLMKLDGFIRLPRDPQRPGLQICVIKVRESTQTYIKLLGHPSLNLL